MSLYLDSCHCLGLLFLRVLLLSLASFVFFGQLSLCLASCRCVWPAVIVLYCCSCDGMLSLFLASCHYLGLLFCDGMLSLYLVSCHYLGLLFLWWNAVIVFGQLSLSWTIVLVMECCHIVLDCSSCDGMLSLCLAIIVSLSQLSLFWTIVLVMECSYRVGPTVIVLGS